LNVLARPSSVLLLAGIAIAWFVAAGGRRGLVYTSITVGVAVIVVAPWTIRNAVVLHGFLPVSIQTAAGYGPFRAEAAHDPAYPYAFRVHTGAADPIFFHRPPLS